MEVKCSRGAGPLRAGLRVGMRIENQYLVTRGWD